MQRQTIALQQIRIENATQRTVAIMGGKGTGKTTFLKMLLKQEHKVLVFDPLNVIQGESVNAYRISIPQGYPPEFIDKVALLTNKLLKNNDNVVISCINMIQEDEIGLANELIPKIRYKDGYIFIDEVHEFAPLHSGSLEIERFIRHCRNKNIGVVMTTQRPASVKKNVLALTDYLITFRLTWTHDVEAFKKLIDNQVDKEELHKILSELQKFGFMEGFIVDYRGENNGDIERDR